MKRKMTKTEAQAWAARWRLVNQAELDELRKTPPETKLRQLAALMASVDAFGWRAAFAADQVEVRERWNRLRRVYGSIR
jgi:hypothetical protein